MRIALLGATEIEGADSSVTRRDRVVLGALAVGGDEALSVERLADALWGADPPKSAAKVIQGAIVRLRRLLGADAIETTADGYKLVLGTGAIDTHEFESSVARARELVAVHEPERASRAFLQALSMWRGAPLAELQEWDVGRAEAARLTEIRRSVEEELVEVRMESGRAVEAVADARKLVTREPFREHRWALLALALYRSGRQREALDALRRARSTLRDELGLDPGKELAELEAQILQQDPALLDVPSAPASVSPICPYPGLRPFDADQAELFVGREDDIRTCVRRLEEFPLLVVVGGSGSGKSSLVRAGVVPALQEAGRHVITLSPGTSPAATLASALASVTKPDVVVVDQLEELFASAHPSEIETFLSGLTNLTESGTLIAVTLRADYLADLSVHPTFARLAERGLVLLTPMTEDDLRRAIVEPARRSGLLLEPGLVDLLIREVAGEAGGLPLMSHALAETWAERDGNVLTVDGYTRTGGIRGAVAQSAERLYDSLSARDRANLRGVLRRLVTPTAGEPMAARVPTRVFAATADAPRLLDLLVRARLVTTSVDTATIAHESLVRAWPRLRTWLDEDVEGQRVLQHLQVAADGWDAAGRPDDELYRGARLTTAVEWRECNSQVLSDSEADFLTASTVHEQTEERRRAVELEHHKKRNRQLRWSLGGVAAFLVLALLAAGLAAIRGRQAQRSADAARAAVTQADAARIAAASRSENKIDLALLMARQSAALSDNPMRQADVLAAIVRADVVRSSTSPVPPKYEVGDSASPDGSRIEATDDNDTVRIVDTSTGRSAGGAIPGDGAGFYDDGTKLAVVRDAGGARVIVSFDARDAHQLGTPEPLPKSVSGDFFNQDKVHISPDGTVLLSFQDRQARVWRRDGGGWRGPTRVALPAFPRSIPGHDFLMHATFSDDARYATMSIGEQGPPNWATVVSIAMDLHTMRAVSAWSVGGSNASVSPDGGHWAVGTLGSGFEIRPTDTAATTVVRVPTSLVASFAWSADGERLAVSGADGSVAVYQVDPLLLLRQFPASGVPVAIVALVDGGTSALSVQIDGAIMMRSVIGANAVLRVTPTSDVSAVAAGPPGTVVAGGLDDGRVAVLDQKTGSVLRTLWLGPYNPPDTTFEPARHLRVTAVAVTPDGTAIVAGNRSGHLRMWRASDGALLWTTTVGPVEQLAVSPDGRFLATVESVEDPNDPGSRVPDGDPMTTTFRLWDLRTHKVLLSVSARRDDGSAVKAKMLQFSPDSAMVAVPYMTEMVQVYRTASRGKPVEISAKAISSSGAGAVTFTPDSSTLLVRPFDGSAIIPFDPRSGRRLKPAYPGPAGEAYGMIGFNPDGRWLFSRTPNGLSAYEVSSRRLLLSNLSLGSNEGEGSMAIVSDGQLYAATHTGIARLDIDPTRWEATACSLAGRSLTRDEWSRLLPNRAYAPACTH